MKKKYILFFLSFFIILSFLLRIYNLGSNPFGFFADEASIGFNAYSILTTGKDEHGEIFPFFFKAFGEYKSPIQIYSTIPFIYFLGLNEFSVRLVSVFWSIAVILAIYMLGKSLAGDSKNKDLVGIFSAVMISVSPWFFHFSRIAFELIPFIFFTVLATYFLIEHKNKSNIIFSAVLFGLALYTYNPARLFIPPYLFFLVIIYAKELIKNWRNTWIAFLVGGIIIIPLAAHTFSPHGIARFKMVSIFDNKHENQSVPLHIANNYISHFSLDFLFLKGDIDMFGQPVSRHSVRGFGELYLFQLPIIIVGIIFLLIKKKYKELGLLITWVLTYPLGSMFTSEASAQATRSIIGVVPFQLLSAFGIVCIYSALKNNRLRIIFIIFIFSLVALSFMKYFISFHTQYPLYASDFYGWQAGFKESVTYMNARQENFDDLLITHRFNGGHILLKFYNIQLNCIKCGIMNNPISINTNRKQMLVLRQEDIDEARELFADRKFYVENTIRLPDNKPVLYIGIFKP